MIKHYLLYTAKANCDIWGELKLNNEWDAIAEVIENLWELYDAMHFGKTCVFYDEWSAEADRLHADFDKSDLELAKFRVASYRDFVVGSPAK